MLTQKNLLNLFPGLPPTFCSKQELLGVSGANLRFWDRVGPSGAILEDNLGQFEPLGDNLGLRSLFELFEVNLGLFAILVFRRL